MPRTTQEIIDHADELAARFEAMDPAPGDIQEATELRALRAAALHRADAEREIIASVEAARVAGYAWAIIGSMLGTSGSAVQQRYRHLGPRMATIDSLVPHGLPAETAANARGIGGA